MREAPSREHLRVVHLPGSSVTSWERRRLLGRPSPALLATEERSGPRAARSVEPFFVEESETLRTLAEVAVALTGFTGIVAVLGRRAGGEWAPLEMLRLRMLLETSLGVLFLSLLPLVMQTLRPSEQSLWRVSNGLECLVYLGGLLLLCLRVSKLEPSQWPPEEKWLTAALVPLSLVILGLEAGFALGILTAYGSFAYLLGLAFLLGLAALHFVLLLIPGSK